MLIKGQNAENFRNKDTFKIDCFPNVKMRFVLENPPFGTPWAGADAKEVMTSPQNLHLIRFNFIPFM